jgi:CRP-like cAMP-binding protein
MSDILTHCEGLPEARFAVGETLLTEGERNGRLYILVEGSVVVTKKGIRVAQVDDSGALFGEMAALLGLPGSATVSALTPVRVRVSDDPLGFIRAKPEVALHTARLLAARLHNATTYLTDLKIQFQDRSDHFGMMDRILDAMVEQQPKASREVAASPDDPRL